MERVVVADDNRFMATALRVVLERWGWSVVITYDGLSALAAIRAMRPAAALIDIGLPKLDGLKVARTIRREALGPRTLVALSGYGDEGDRQLSRDAGFDQHLVKPIDPDVLHAALVRVASQDVAAVAPRVRSVPHL